MMEAYTELEYKSRRQIRRLLVPTMQGHGSLTNEFGGLVMPRRWHDLVIKVSNDLTGCDPVECKLQNLFDSASIILSWGPNAFTCLAALVTRRLIYICWEPPPVRRRNLRGFTRWLRLFIVVKFAATVVVNDELTLRDLRARTGRSAIVIPFFVDTKFFMRPQRLIRTATVVVPGNKDRVEDLVKAVAAAGFMVTRVSSHERVLGEYGGRGVDMGNLRISYKVSFAELRDIYLRAGVVVIPLADDSSAAGQTSALEAAACGCRIAISEGRSSSILPKSALIRNVAGLKVVDWLEAIQSLLDLDEEDARVGEIDLRKWIVSHCSESRVVGLLSAALAS